MSPWLAGKLSEYLGEDALEAAIQALQGNARSNKEKADWKKWSGAAAIIMGIAGICAIDSQSIGYVAALPFFPLYIMNSIAAVSVVVVLHRITTTNAWGWRVI